MLASNVFRAPTVFRAGLRTPATRSASLTSKRFQQLDNRGGKTKLVFRFGLRDIPVELYPIGFVVGAGVLGGTFALGRHLYKDGLIKPSPSPVDPQIYKTAA